MKWLDVKKFSSIEVIEEGFEDVGYICTTKIATTLYLAYHLGKPVPLIRLQCYEGLDESKALYEWKYGKQLLYTQILKEKLNDVVQKSDGLSESIEKLHQHDDIFFSGRFLEPRPLLKALQEDEGSVLLVDEVDKSDQEFEAFLLEVLSDFQVSIPEIGTVSAVTKPFVFLTSNNTREMSEALKRRCLHLFIPFPDPKLERRIIRTRVPEVSERLRKQLVSFIQQVRTLDLKKVPSISETIDWARVLLFLHSEKLSAELVRETINVFLKFEEDIKVVEDRLHEFTQKSLAGS
jgi:MoxR-like ATPase